MTTDERLLAAIRELRQLEDKYGIDLCAKGGAYGAAYLAIRDRRSGEIFDVEAIECETVAVGTSEL